LFQYEYLETEIEERQLCKWDW